MLRVAGKDTGLLGIDRTVELAATEAAAALGIGPEVVAFVEPEGWLVTRFVAGAIPPLERMREPVMLARIAGALRAFHDGPAIPGTFDSFRVVETYRETALARGGRVPEAFDWAHAARDEDRGEAVGRQRGAVPQRPPERELPRRRRAAVHRGLGVRGHGRSLLRPRELLDQPRARRGCEPSRCWRPTSARYALETSQALELMRFMSDFREAMWGVVQSAVSELDFDFDAYASEHFERLRRTAESPAFVAALGLKTRGAFRRPSYRDVNSLRRFGRKRELVRPVLLPAVPALPRCPCAPAR